MLIGDRHMKRTIAMVAGALLLWVTPAWTETFTVEDNGAALTIIEDGKPVLSYLYTLVEPPGGVDKNYRRASYIHPLYGLDGDVLTQDFPEDHYHQRGVFWAWPGCKVGERDLNTWEIGAVRQLFEKWLVREIGSDYVTIGVQNAWVFDDNPKPVVRENIRFRVHPADQVGRCIDFHLRFENVSHELVTFKGQPYEDKGYGGFCYRPDNRRPDWVITTAGGVLNKDALLSGTPWGDFSTRKGPAETFSGAAIFQHPGNPGYPHPGWLLRFEKYGFLGASWPHLEPVPLEPGESFELRYRLYVHRGTAEEGQVSHAFETFATSCKGPFAWE